MLSRVPNKAKAKRLGALGNWDKTAKYDAEAKVKGIRLWDSFEVATRNHEGSGRTFNRLLIIASLIFIGAGLILILAIPQSALGPTFLVIGALLTFGYVARTVYS